MDRSALTATAGSTRAVLQRLAEVHAAGASVVLAVVVETQGSTYRKRGALSLIEADGRKTGVLSGGCLEQTLVQAALAALEQGQAAWQRFDSLGDDDLLFGSGSGCRGVSQVLLWPLQAQRDAPLLQCLLTVLAPPACCVLRVDSLAAIPAPVLQSGHAEVDADAALAALQIGPLPRVWMVGAGVEAMLLARLLQAQGFWLGLSEHRGGWRDALDPAGLDLLLPQRPQSAAARLLPAEVMLIMSHSAAVDLEALRTAAAAAVPVVGLLGPPARRDELLGQLDDSQRERLLGRLHAPVGLRLGGEGPLAIALSISAWLQGLGGGSGWFPCTR